MPKLAAGFVFTHHDRRRLTTALHRVRDARHCRRVQAVLLVAEGHGVGGTAVLLKASRRWVTQVLARYRVRRCPADLAEGPRPGRPRGFRPHAWRNGQQTGADWWSRLGSRLNKQH